MHQYSSSLFFLLDDHSISIPSLMVLSAKMKMKIPKRKRNKWGCAWGLWVYAVVFWKACGFRFIWARFT